MFKNALETVKNIENQKKRGYVCIHCGAQVDELYKKYTEAVLKLSECSECGEIVDKYIEFETIIILIDLVLLSQQAYRHVIYNVESKNLWKLAVILCLLESYCVWVERFNVETEPKLFELEKAFYFSALEVIFSNFLLYVSIGLLGATSNCFGEEKISRFTFAFNLLRALILASIGNFFFLPIMIWKENTTSTQVAIHLSLVVGYFIVSLVRGHSVVSQVPQKSSLFIVILSFLATSSILNEVDPVLKSLFF